MIAVIPVRDGILPAGADEAVAECGGAALLVGSGLGDVDLTGVATTLWTLDLGVVELSRWAQQIASAARVLDDGDRLLLPHSADGRDLAPLIAGLLERPLFAGATEVTAEQLTVARRGGRELHQYRPHGPFVATLQPGVRGVEPTPGTGAPTVTELRPADVSDHHDARVIEVLPPDVRTMDLSESSRIVGGGAGLESEERFAELGSFAEAIGASMGATRVITDRSWVHHDKQIGTTGVVVDPTLYLSFGVSGAVQHTAGLGTPDHIVSVNTDPHCPMMQMSDLAVVSDANATLDALRALVGNGSESQRD